MGNGQVVEETDQPITGSVFQEESVPIGTLGEAQQVVEITLFETLILPEKNEFAFSTVEKTTSKIKNDSFNKIFFIKKSRTFLLEQL